MCRCSCGTCGQPGSDAAAEAALCDPVPASGIAARAAIVVLLVGPDAEVDLCSIDPGFDVNLYVSTDLRTMTAIWMGLDTVRAALATERMTLTGDRRLAADMQSWLGLSPFARQLKLAS